MNEYCHNCHSALTSDEVALTKKLTNRGTKIYYCITCLSRKYEVDETVLVQKILDFKEMGCTLFQK